MELEGMQGAGGIPRGETLRDWEEVASALLEDGLVLTALELHAELLEMGKELSSLRDYFSNPGNFESAFPQPPTALLGSDLGSYGVLGCTYCLFKYTYSALYVYADTYMYNICVYNLC